MNLDYKHIENCKLLPNRYIALDHIPKGGVVAELGVLGGDFSKHILSRTNPERLFLIDTFCSNDWDSTKRFTSLNHEEFIKNDFAKEIESGQVKMMKGLSWDLLDIFPNHYFDWLYIDADHRYNSVKKDLSIAINKIKEDGIIMMNDYIMYDHVMKEDYGVIQAVNEFCVEHNYELIYLALHPQMFCDVMLRKIKS
jgi:hypothetical protein